MDEALGAANEADMEILNEFGPLDGSHLCDACHVAVAHVRAVALDSDNRVITSFVFCGHHFDQHSDALYVHYGPLLVDDFRSRLVEPGGLRTGVSA